MATREENLKKINEQLEILSDEELDKVAGGTCYQTADDSRFLNSLNGSCDRYGAFRTFWGTGSSEIKNAWKKVGIEADFDNALLGENVYKLNGKIITQEEARQHAMKVVGKQMTKKDWDW